MNSIRARLSPCLNPQVEENSLGRLQYLRRFLHCDIIF